MDRDGNGFKFLKNFFGADKSDAKLKAGVFVGSKTKKVILNEEFDLQLNQLDWNALKSVVADVLGNQRHDQCADIVDCMLKAYERLRTRKSLKCIFCISTWISFPLILAR